MNVKTSILHGNLNEKIFMEQPVQQKCKVATKVQDLLAMSAG